jgi:putative nucleotidyltransferase with HDIG domain
LPQEVHVPPSKPDHVAPQGGDWQQALGGVLDDRLDAVPTQYRVLVVDDDDLVLPVIERTLRAESLVIDAVREPAAALRLISEEEYAVVLTDFRMAGMNGIELCERVRRRSPDTICVLLTGHADLQMALSAINRAGVFRFLTKPWARGELRAAVSQACEQYRMTRELRFFGQMLERRNEQLHLLNQLLDREVQRRTGELLLGLINALDLRDNETQGHSRRVALYARRLAEQLGLTRGDILDVERGALLHDIGKIGVSDRILLKPGKLTDEEWHEMRKHALHGFEILRGIDFLGNARQVVRNHHERFDGAGYPDKLAGEGIPIGARIFAVIDTYDAMTSDRPYRKALPPAVAREEIVKQSGCQFDPECAAAFLKIDQPELDKLRAKVATSEHAGLD